MQQADKYNSYCDDLYSFLDSFVDVDTCLVVAVSGGVDSMVLSDMMVKYMQKRDLDMSNLCFAHYVHNVREDAHREYDLLSTHFTEKYGISHFYGASRVDNFTDNQPSEAVLRKLRYTFLFDVCRSFQEISPHSRCVVVTGHHMDDRIETTLLHLERGCSLRGIVNMSTFVDTSLFPLVRPLLSLHKSVLYGYAQEYGIFYWEDVTNRSSDISRRNFWRSSLQNTHSLSDDIYPAYRNIFYSNFTTLYDILSSVEQAEIRYFTKHSPFVFYSSPPLRNIEKKFVGLRSDQPLTSRSLLYTLHALGSRYSWYGESLGHLLEFIDRQKASQRTGWYWVHDIVCCVAHGEVYLFLRFPDDVDNTSNEKKKFWLVKPQGPLPDGYNDRDGWRWGKRTDIYRGKKLGRYLMNQKIPVFWRPFVLVQEVDNVVNKVDIIKMA